MGLPLPPARSAWMICACWGDRDASWLRILESQRNNSTRRRALRLAANGNRRCSFHWRLRRGRAGPYGVAMALSLDGASAATTTSLAFLGNRRCRLPTSAERTNRPKWADGGGRGEPSSPCDIANQKRNLDNPCTMRKAVGTGERQRAASRRLRPCSRFCGSRFTLRFGV